MLTEKEFSQIINQIFSKKIPKKLAVAVSGGLDSMALLVLLKNTLHKKSEIFCVTIDHNVRKNSASDAKFVADFCKKNGIHCTILKSYLENPPEADIENSLREVRYNLFESFCVKQKIKNLLIAHHRDDDAENFLIRLFRGSGIDGLAAMDVITKMKKINIIRPLLDFSKDDLRQYLQSSKTKWVEDETNADEKFLRNKIRKFLQTLPDYQILPSRISLASKAMREAKKIIDLKTKKEFPKIFIKEKNNLKVNLEKFADLEKSVATRYLALALMKVSGRVYKPRLKKLERLYQVMIENKLKKNEEFYGCVLEEIAKNIVVIKPKS